MRQLLTPMMLVGFVSAATGCVSAQPRPSVYAYPASGQSVEQAARDEGECEAWAKRQTGFDPVTDTAKGAGIGAMMGALAGAAAGAAIGAAAGSPGKGAAIGAAAGGLGGAGVGGTIGYTKNRESYDKAYAACMESRGYKIK